MHQLHSSSANTATYKLLSSRWTLCYAITVDTIDPKKSLREDRQVGYKVQTFVWIDSVSNSHRQWKENEDRKKWSKITNYEHEILVVSAIGPVGGI